MAAKKKDHRLLILLMLVPIFLYSLNKSYKKETEIKKELNKKDYIEEIAELIKDSYKKNNDLIDNLTSSKRKEILNDDSLSLEDKTLAIAELYHDLFDEAGINYDFGGSYHKKGRSKFGFDCSGYLWNVLSDVGLVKKNWRMKSTHFASSEFIDGKLVRDDYGNKKFSSYDSIKDIVKRGDIIVWNGHVAMCFDDKNGKHTFIHSTRIDFNENGKYDPEELVGIRKEGSEMLDRVYEQDGKFSVVRPNYGVGELHAKENISDDHSM